MAYVDLSKKGDQPDGLNRHTRRELARVFRRKRVHPRYIHSIPVLPPNIRPSVPTQRPQPAKQGSSRGFGGFVNKLRKNMARQVAKQIDNTLLTGSPVLPPR